MAGAGTRARARGPARRAALPRPFAQRKTICSHSTSAPAQTAAIVAPPRSAARSVGSQSSSRSAPASAAGVPADEVDEVGVEQALARVAGARQQREHRGARQQPAVSHVVDELLVLAPVVPLRGGDEADARRAAAGVAQEVVVGGADRRCRGSATPRR